MTERKKSGIILAICLVLLLVMGYIEQCWPAGQQCNWASDCGYGEMCKPLKYYQRDNPSYNGICVPKEW